MSLVCRKSIIKTDRSIAFQPLYELTLIGNVREDEGVDTLWKRAKDVFASLENLAASRFKGVTVRGLVLAFGKNAGESRRALVVLFFIAVQKGRQ